MRKKKPLAFILCILTVSILSISLSACGSKKEQSEETVLENEEYEADDDDSYETFETLLQNLAEGLNEGDMVLMKQAIAGGNIPGTFLTISGNYILDFELIGVVDDAILEGDEIEQAFIDNNLIDEEYVEYARQATKACFLEVAITQTTISDNSVSTNNEAIIIALKTDGKWVVVPWI